MCPQCGAEVSLRSAATPVAVCSFCRSTLARDGDALKRLGSSAELFDDHSPLQVGTVGVWQDKPFTIVGRLQWRTADSVWSEWVALFDIGSRAWLSEDNGRYVFAFDAALPGAAASAFGNPATSRAALDALQAGQRLRLGDREWSVASVVQARVAAAEGELPQAPTLDVPTTVVDLRSDLGEVATLAADGRTVSWSVGRGVELAALQLRQLRADDAKTASTQAAPCPSCGTPLQVKLDTTKSITCAACKAIVDVSQGVGGQLSHVNQSSRTLGRLAQPLIPLGATAMLELGSTKTAWQAVGYMVRRVEPELGDDPEPPWSEYLLYSRGVGFAFLVNGEDGWSWAIPITGVPKPRGDHAQWQGRLYDRRYDYNAETIFVLGEFYWQVKRNQRSHNTDYAHKDWRLNREQQNQEVTWSDGRTLQARPLLSAFGVSPSTVADPLAGLDTQPFSASAFNLKHIIMIIVVLVFLFVLLRSCSTDRCDSTRQTYGASSIEYQQCLRRSGGSSGVRSGGGSWGGSSGGGGHK